MGSCLCPYQESAPGSGVGVPALQQNILQSGHLQASQKNSSVKILCNKLGGRGSKSSKFCLVYIYNHHFFISFHKIVVPHRIYHQCLVNISHCILIVHISLSLHHKYHHNITVHIITISSLLLICKCHHSLIHSLFIC